MIEVLHDCGCVGPRSNIGAMATCPLHGRCEAVGVKLLRTALSLKAPAPWLDDGPRPSDQEDPR